MQSNYPTNPKDISILFSEVFAKPQICQETQDYLKQFSTYESVWLDILAKNDVVTAYGWMHATTGNTDLIIKSLVELYSNWSSYFSPQIYKWFEAIKLGDISINKEMTDFLETKSEKIDMFFAMGFLRLLSKDYGDTGNCIACLGNVIFTLNREDSNNQEIEINRAKQLAMKILIKNFNV